MNLSYFAKSGLFFVLLFIALHSGSTAQAKDLTERLGLGFKNNTSQSLPSLAVAYYPTKQIALTGSLGVNSEKNYSSFQVNAGARKMLFMENNLNFYTGAQLGLASYETPANGRDSGLEVMGVFGAEFFFAGLENLAFTFEAGLAVSSVKETRFRTVGDDPFHAGVIFYF